MGNNKLIALAAGTAAGDSVTLAQAQSAIVAHATSLGGTVDAITAAFSPAFTAYASKMRFRFTASGANAVVAPTINVDWLGAKTIKRLHGQALDVADIAGAGHVCDCVYDGTDVLLLNFAPITVGEANIFTATQTFGKPTVHPYSLLIDAATIAWDMAANSGNVKIVLSASRNLGAPTNLVAGQSGLILLQQDGTDGWSLTPNAIFKQAGAQTIFDLDKTANSKTVYFYEVIEDHTAAKVVLIKRLWSEGKTSMGFYKEYDLGAYSAVGLVKTQAHGLGRYPAFALLFLENTATDFGYAVGERIFIPFGAPTDTGGGGNSGGLGVSMDATNVYIILPSGIAAYDKGLAGFGPISFSKWKFVLRVFE